MMKESLLQLLESQKLDIAAIENYVQHQQTLNFYCGAEPFLHKIIAADAHDILSFILSLAQIDLEMTDDTGCTALLFAIKADFLSAAQLILTKNPKLDSQDVNGNTALHLALNKKQVPLVTALLAAGANPNIANKNGEYPLHIAVEKYQVEVLQALTQATNLDVNVKNNWQETVSHQVLARDQAAILAKLLELPTLDLTLKNLSARTALEEAVYFGHQACLETFFNATRLTITRDEKYALGLLAAERGQLQSLQYFEQIMPEIMQTIPLAQQILHYIDSDFLHAVLSQFNQNFSTIDELGGQLAFAQIKARKPNDFNGYVINSADFCDFLKALETYAQFNRHAKEQIIFTLVDTHWLAGCIEIDNSQIKICIIDALGANDSISNTVYDIIETIPHVTKIYEIQDIKQFSPVGCATMAIDDCDHLANVNHYLRATYKKSDYNFFDYLEENKYAVINFINKYDPDDSKEYQLVRTKLPLYLTRTTQSLKTAPQEKLQSFFWIDRATAAERSNSINKQQETVIASVLKNVKTGKNKLFNMRLESKLDRLLAKNLKFILEHTPAELKAAMYAVSLAGFLTTVEQLAQTASIKNNLS